MKAYYVSPTGDDGNSGTVDRPFKTIQKAVAQTAGESRTIYLRGGTYDLNEGAEQSEQVAGLHVEGQWQVGSDSDSLIIQAYAGERPVLDGRYLAPGSTGIFLKDIQNVEIRGLEIHSAPSIGIEVVNGKNIGILNNVVHGNQESGIGVRGYLAGVEANGETAQRSEDVRIEGNWVYHNVLNNSGDREGQQNWGGALYVRHTARATIANNWVYENHGEGIIALQSQDVAIAHNTVYDNYSVNVYLDNASDTTVNHNLIYTTENTSFFRSDGETARPASNIGLANEVYNNIEAPSLYYLNNIEVANNVLVGGMSGLYYGTYSGNHSYMPGSHQGLKNAHITNNTIYNPQTSFIHLDADPETENVEFSNNIFSQPDWAARQMDIASGQGLSFSHNLWGGGDRSANQNGFVSPSDVIADPILANPGGLNFQDYQLQPNSPAIDAAKVVTGVSDNAIGQPDIGAIEFEGATSSSSGSGAALTTTAIFDPFWSLTLMLMLVTLIKKI